MDNKLIDGPNDGKSARGSSTYFHYPQNPRPALPGFWDGEQLSTPEFWKGVSPEARLHIQRSMNALERGADHVPSFKLYGRVDDGVAIEFISKFVKTRSDVSDWQKKYELSRLEKWGPQGGYAPWSEVQADFELYYTRPTFIDLGSDYPEVVRDVQEKYCMLHAKKLPLDGTLAHLVASDKIKERASGWRAFDLKKTDPEAMGMALADAISGFWKHGWGYVFERFNKLKKRIFFPMPFSDMLLEAQYFVPFLEAIQASLETEGYKSPFIFWADKLGFNKMYRDIVSPLCRAKDADFSKIVFVQRDFEKMDTTSGFLQTQKFFIPSIANGLGIAFGTKEYQALSDLLEFGATCPILTPNGIYSGYRGKASGAETTNGDETCGNECFNAIFMRILTYNCAFEGIRFRELGSFGNGDDGSNLFELRDLEDLPAFKKCVASAAEIAGTRCGYRVQGSKFTVDHLHGVYCQQMLESRPATREIWNAYPAVLILNSIINPEHSYAPSKWDKDYRDLDIIGKLDNGRNLQYFTDLVDYVDNGMKYRLLGTQESDLRRIVSKWEAWKLLRYDDFNVRSEAYNDITKSPTLRYLLAKRHQTLG